MPFSANEILEILDKGAESYDFPMLDNIYFYLGKIKLILFRNDNEWLIVFQKISFSIRAGDVDNTIIAFGNKLKENGIQSIQRLIPYDLNHMFDDNNNFLLNLFHFKVVIHNIEREFNPTRKDYQKLGIDLDDRKTTDEAKLTRYLTYTIPEELFLRPARLLEICRRNENNPGVFLELEDWYHPDLVNDEKPSEISNFQSLAEALAKNDQSLYQCPEEDYNTHWSNWEWYKEE